MSGITGKVALITGAARGIGFACAQSLGRAGAKTVLVDVSEANLEKAAASLKAEGIDAAFAVADVSKREDLEKAVAFAVETFGSVDIGVANAGIVRTGTFLDLTDDDWEAVIKVNLTGVFLTGQVIARQMVKQGHGGAIVNMSSVNGVMALPTIPSYNAAKGGINNLTRNMALNLAPHGIRVNAVGPGSIVTEVLREVLKEREQARAALCRIPQLRFGESIEVGNVVKFLASEDASYVTGQILYVDGGRMALNYTVPVPEEKIDAFFDAGKSSK